MCYGNCMSQNENPASASKTTCDCGKTSPVEIIGDGMYSQDPDNVLIGCCERSGGCGARWWAAR